MSKILTDWVFNLIQKNRLLKLEVFAKIQPGAQLETNILGIDEKNETIFFDPSQDLKVELIQTLSTMDTKGTAYFELSWKLGDTAPTTKLHSGYRPPPKVFSDQKYGLRFANLVADTIKFNEIKYCYDPRDGDEHSIWLEDKRYNIGRTNGLDLRTREILFSFNDRNEFVSWLSEQSDLTFHNQGLALGLSLMNQIISSLKNKS